MIDFANANATRHALLMDPATQFEGGQPVVGRTRCSGSSPPTLIGGVRPVFMDFGADGALYVGSYAGSYYAFSNANAMGVWRFAYTGGQDTPGPDPKAIVPRDRQRRAVQHRHVRRRLLHVGLRRRQPEGDDHRPIVSRTPTTRPVDKTATLTVNYADGDDGEQDRRGRGRADAAVHQRRRGGRRDVPTGARAHARRRRRASARSRRRSTVTTPPRRRPRCWPPAARALLDRLDPATATAGRLVNARLHAAVEAPGQGARARRAPAARSPTSAARPVRRRC